MDKLKRLENLVGYEFKNKELLKEALTHKSMKTGCNNEHLEFLSN